jgi:polysaccharide export outer membrane protein
MKRLLVKKPAFLAIGIVAAFMLDARVSRSQVPENSLGGSAPSLAGETTEDYNRRLEQLRHSLAELAPTLPADEYRVGPHDLLEINVFEAPELNRTLRVSAGGEISMPLLGAIQAAGLTARELEVLLEYRLREYMKMPHVGVLVTSIESHPISVVGAVKKPGVFQVRGPKSVLEMLSLAEGLADDAGDEVLVMRGAGLRFVASHASELEEPSPAQPSTPSEAAPQSVGASGNDGLSSGDTIRVNLVNLLESGDPQYNVAVYPGDIVKVTRAGIVYVVGDVKKPGGFVLKGDEKMSVLKAIALAEGLTATSAKSRAQVIRTDKGGQRAEVPINLGKILAGKAPDPPLRPGDIVFVPNSAGRSALYRGTEAAIATASGVLIFHP